MSDHPEPLDDERAEAFEAERELFFDVVDEQDDDPLPHHDDETPSAEEAAMHMILPAEDVFELDDLAVHDPGLEDSAP